jgi:hypothetical protein
MTAAPRAAIIRFFQARRTIRHAIFVSSVLRG